MKYFHGDYKTAMGGELYKHYKEYINSNEPIPIPGLFTIDENGHKLEVGDFFKASLYESSPIGRIIYITNYGLFSDCMGGFGWMQGKDVRYISRDDALLEALSR